MTQITDPPTSWPSPVPDPNLDGIHVLGAQTNDYVRRIHWWVRLFGVVWLSSVALAVIGFVYIAAAATKR